MIQHVKCSKTVDFKKKLTLMIKNHLKCCFPVCNGW